MHGQVIRTQLSAVPGGLSWKRIYVRHVWTNRIRCLDTRLYFASRDFYLKHLAAAHLQVDDPKGYFLEYSYLDRLRECGLKGFTLPVMPIVVGRSGSDDVEYEVPGFYKRLVRGVRHYVFNKIY